MLGVIKTNKTYLGVSEYSPSIPVLNPKIIYMLNVDSSEAGKKAIISEEQPLELSGT